MMSSSRTITTGSSSLSANGAYKTSKMRSGDGSVVVVWGKEEDSVAAETTRTKESKSQKKSESTHIREETPQSDTSQGGCNCKKLLLAIFGIAIVLSISLLVRNNINNNEQDNDERLVRPGRSNSPVDTEKDTASPSDAAKSASPGNSPAPTTRPTYFPTSAPTEWKLTCGCNDCIEEILNTDARGETCESRIMREMEDNGLAEVDACSKIATNYPLECGPHCHPDKCDGKAPAHCSCEECTDEIFQANTGFFTCHQFMLLKLGQLGSNGTEEEACTIASERYPDICGVGCNPLTCLSNNAPTVAPTEPPIAEHCGCFSCTEEAWNADAGGATCGDRITWLESLQGGGLNSTWACLQIANEEYPEECSACNPLTCYKDERHFPKNAPPPTFCGCAECVPDMLDRDANGVSCANRMAWLQTPVGDSHNEIEACTKITKEDYPAFCSRSCDPTSCDGRAPPLCGCESCTDSVLQREADGFSCAQRIFFLMTSAGGRYSENEACRKIGGRDYDHVCGECDPTTC